MGASAAFSFYLDNFGHESRTYGAFAGVAVLLLWLFVAAVAVLLGAELNCELARPDPGSAPARPDV
jgi:membrane protein